MCEHAFDASGERRAHFGLAHGSEQIAGFHRPAGVEVRGRLEQPGGRTYDDTLGHEEMFALVMGRGRLSLDAFEQCVEVAGSVDRQRLGSVERSLHGAAQHRARADLDERIDAPITEGMKRLAPSDRAAQLRGEQAGPLAGAVVGAGIDVGEDRNVERGGTRSRRAPCGGGRSWDAMNGVWNVRDELPNSGGDRLMRAPFSRRTLVP